jgi:cell division protein FtsI (penicillin-binding protein 3)
VQKLNRQIKKQEQLYAAYYDKEAKVKDTIPNIIGMSGMDAVALLGNMGLKVQVIGIGKVKKQSLKPGEPVSKNQTIILELS